MTHQEFLALLDRWNGLSAGMWQYWSTGAIFPAEFELGKLEK